MPPPFLACHCLPFTTPSPPSSLVAIVCLEANFVNNFAYNIENFRSCCEKDSARKDHIEGALCLGEKIQKKSKHLIIMSTKKGRWGVAVTVAFAVRISQQMCHFNEFSLATKMFAAPSPHRHSPFAFVLWVALRTCLLRPKVKRLFCHLPFGSVSRK